MIVVKVLTQLVYPMNLSLAVMVLALLLLLIRFRRTGMLLLLFSGAWLWVWSAPVTADRVRQSLEHAHPPVPVDELPEADAIVVLGGGVGPAEPPRLLPDLGPAADRVWHAARLFQAGKAPVIVVSGGRGLVPDAEKLSESGAMRLFLEDLGVPERAVLEEAESRNTYENALYTKEVLDSRGDKKILLVTSALHMRRAKAIFESMGFQVTPAATDYEVLDEAKPSPLPWLPDTGSLDGASRALKEYLGLIAFRVRGK